MEIPNQQILLERDGIELFVKREDLIDPFVSGNKFRKLKYNLEQARLEGKSTLLTFGGAFSNHIAAVASAGKTARFNTIGIIRGEEIALVAHQNPTLSFALQNGMQLEFINRENYRKKGEDAFVNALKLRFGDFYLLPEGGTNALAVKGCEEILTSADARFNYICSAVGTGGTLAGLSNSGGSAQKFIGFSSLKGDFLADEVRKYSTKNNWEINTDYHFGGYAKVTSELVEFINRFNAENKIQLDPVYTGKMLFGIFDLIKKGYFPKGSKILAIHTGGLQGIAGMNQRLQNKNIQLS
ncbi:MAG: 1-aminocyclopropane-1-carboxylate deaminase/D-cysteine desulfhydrase [Flavobacterium sp.]|uniref:1-aminocyclopropane-1-carboxylate deaminase/D-cysteine desulfhydrase n=1 Tax=Flavobacterium sp. TaxID=239 RepID=UPI00122539F5|nr:pyridoxal-phosphate dependent enzyme [Flavobacterium sp.]RZJ64282.1 MAG: 1-aminocyclopropane-1-carboxylate deaminase/D-cysteine desulfhydrase [Flavobacterium sp.]